LQDDADECLKRNECDGIEVKPINVLTAGDRITLEPAHGDLKLTDIKISAAGNTGPGVDIIFDPIFLDFETEMTDDDTPGSGRIHDFDYMGSRGSNSEQKANPWYLPEWLVSPILTPEPWPEEANAFFYEVNWASGLQSGSPYQQVHPCFQLDTPAEVYCSFQNKTKITNSTFISGKTEEQNSDASHHITYKLTPPTVMAGIKNTHFRVTKPNFGVLTTPGVAPTFKQQIAIKKYHYCRVYLGLGRAKCIPVKVSDLEKAKKWILPQIEQDSRLIEGEEVENTYQQVQADIVRMQGNDLRQAVEQIQSSIDLAVATGTDPATLQDLQTGLVVEILEGDGTFEEIRDRLTSLKAEAQRLGVIGLTKLERNAGVVWDNVGNPA